MYYEVLSRASPEFDVVVAVVDARVRVVLFTCCIQHHAVTLPASLYRPLLCIERHPDDRSPRFQAILIRRVRGRSIIVVAAFILCLLSPCRAPSPLTAFLGHSRSFSPLRARASSRSVATAIACLRHSSAAVICVGWVPMMAMPTPSRSSSRHL